MKSDLYGVKLTIYLLPMDQPFLQGGETQSLTTVTLGTSKDEKIN